jgi:putative hydrolase of the HAD superfamily
MTTRASGRVPKDTVLALDVDGVLLDPERAGAGRWQNALHETYGLDPDLLDDAFFRRSWSEVIVGREPIEPALARALLALAWPVSVEDVLRCWFDADLVIDHEVVRAVNEWAASGVRVVLVTNQEARRASFLESHLGAVLPIEGMAYSGALGVVKRDPTFYPAAEHHLGIDSYRSNVVFVDDSLVNVEAAQRHGWTGIRFSKQSDWRTQIDSALGPEPGLAGSSELSV